MEQLISILKVITAAELSSWVALILAFLVSLLTLYNAAKLRSGILAISTYAFGVGMLCLSVALALLVLPYSLNPDPEGLFYKLFFIIGFLFLAFGSFKVYSMSHLK